MKEEPCLSLFEDCAPAFRFDYRGAAIHQGRLRVDSGGTSQSVSRRPNPVGDGAEMTAI